MSRASPRGRGGCPKAGSALRVPAADHLQDRRRPTPGDTLSRSSGRAAGAADPHVHGVSAQREIAKGPRTQDSGADAGGRRAEERESEVPGPRSRPAASGRGGAGRGRAALAGCWARARPKEPAGGTG